MNTIKSTIYGKAYEYACILAIKEIVSQYRVIEVENNESLAIAKERYQKEITAQDRREMLLSAKSGMMAIIEMEPRIIEDGKDVLSISLQPDNVATQKGDIRDVLIIRRSIKWEIGISVKHNHAALKHSRLSNMLILDKNGWVSLVQNDILRKSNLFLINCVNSKNRGKLGMS